MSAGSPTLGSLAIPGDQWTFRRLIGRIATGSQSVGAMRRSIAERTLHGEWTGRASAKYKAASDDCANNLTNLGAAFDDAHYALTKFLAQLEEAQHNANRIASQLRDYEADLQAANDRVVGARQTVTQARAERDAATSPHEHAARQSALTTAVSSLQSSEAAAEDLQAQVKSLVDSAHANRLRYEEAVRSLCGALAGAHTYAPSEPKPAPSPRDLIGAPAPGPSDVLGPLYGGFD